MSPDCGSQFQLSTPLLTTKKALEKDGGIWEGDWYKREAAVAVHFLVCWGGGRQWMGSSLVSAPQWSFPQILSERMFQIGSLIVLCGLLAQTTALLEALPVPLDQNLPLAVTPALAPSPTDLAGSLTGGK